MMKNRMITQGIAIGLLGIGCLLSAQEMPPTMQSRYVQLQKNATLIDRTTQQVAGLLKSLVTSMRDTRAKGRIRRAEESVQEKNVALLMIMVPLLAKNSYFLRGLKRYGFSKATIDKLIQRFQLQKLRTIVASRGWTGGFSTIVLNTTGRAILSGINKLQKTAYSR